ncbi:MAG: response regulator [Deltaproteobacteria bacterium]|jgi:two-component system, chemotaxis family, chemotaxis protein CheY|nr:response regulator [Deltaproteobacteria bacterium]MBT4640491.1 response regulator [Deltaproteobacteria bacterium]MBT6504501.1 response regulator [Deltaproteobacteria bacterium]MBT7152752.1 response regulator [Deltaproteobacteria bacterium]MBT7713731.1 response regulator [Deltaproteobacteria bacterium]
MAVNSNIRILVVDDFSPMRKALREALEMLKFTNIEEAENGFIALEKLDAAKFDLVISDWTMPEMDGLELLEKIKATEKIKHIPVMMVTAEAAQKNILKVIKAGAANYIVKPITVRTLLTKIEKIFSPTS